MPKCKQRSMMSWWPVGRRSAEMACLQNFEMHWRNTFLDRRTVCANQSSAMRSADEKEAGVSSGTVKGKNSTFSS